MADALVSKTSPFEGSRFESEWGYLGYQIGILLGGLAALALL